ncbi:hypothetical protein JCM8202_003054 [Rhodotorula sphaerocarpa]
MADPEEAAARIPSCAADRSTVHSAAPASAAAATGAEAPTSLVNAAGAVPVNVAAAAAAASPLGPPGSSSAVGGQGAPVYTPYRLPPLLHPAGSSAFSPPPVSPATTTNAGFSLDPRFQAPHPSVPFGSGSAGGAGAGGRGSRPPPPPTHSLSAPTALGGAGSLNGGPGSTSDVPVHDPPPPQHQNPLDALMHLHAAAGGADTSEAALLALDAAAAAAANGGGGAGKEPPVPPKVVQKADRSCKKCRERRVRCGREFPACARCKKRRDACSYGEGVFVEESVEGSDQQRITDLETKIAALQQQLRTATSSTSYPGPPSLTLPAASTSTSSAALTQDSLANEISRHFTESLSLSETATLHNFIVEDQGTRTNAFGGMEQRLSTGGLADAVTCYLLDAAQNACDARQPGFAYLVSQIPFYRSRLRNLGPAEQVGVAILCTLGARASPHHSLYGVSSVHAGDGVPCPALFSTVGERREQVCKVLEMRARETAWATGLYRQRTPEALAAVVGLATLSLHEENDPEETRCYVRQAAGLFVDIRVEEMSKDRHSTLGNTLGTAIFLADAYLSTRCGKPTLITANDLQDYYVSSGFVVPDLVNLTIGNYVEERGRNTFAPQDAAEIITTLLLYVMACYRVFAQVTTPCRRPNLVSLFSFIRNLWNIIDQVHNAVQRFQQQLVSLPTPPPGSSQTFTPHEIDHAILLAVWADVALVTLVGHVHTFVQEAREGPHLLPGTAEHDDLVRIRAESFMRVYKCLKLLSFYCQLLCGSRDKHNVFHLLAQLSPLTAWTTLVTLRIGQPGGPISEEFEVTAEEVDWFRMALELSLFYSPRLSSELRSLAFARESYMHEAAPPAPPASLAAAGAMYAPESASEPSPPSATSGALVPPIVHGVPSLSSNGVNGPATMIPSGHVASFSLDVFESSGQNGFADGAPEDLDGTTEGTANMRTAFRSIDWADLSLTPAVGSDGSNSSADEWMKGRRA